MRNMSLFAERLAELMEDNNLSNLQLEKLIENRLWAKALEIDAVK